ncbi:transmembrane signal receptor [Lithospermum erythrorhizon]|uniref:Transmembrane signal receptor n=1 Tax=Lithospermum erythrorhizon TaxID=34254 RepID=A0AAV3QFL9_LITER
MSVEEYFDKLQPLWDELHNLTPFPEPLPSLDTAYQKIREEESQRKSSDTSIGNEFVALALRSNSRMGDYGDKSKLFCTLCKKQGHDITTCFLKVGYPDWWETRNRKGGRSGGGVAPGNRVAALPGTAATGNKVPTQAFTGGGAALHAVFSDSAREVGAGPPCVQRGSEVAGACVQRGSEAAGAVPVMSPDQWQRLMSLIGNPETPSTSERLMGKPTILPWIFDTGATVHATGTLDCLVDQFDDIPCPLTLPDGSVIYATRRATWCFELIHCDLWGPYRTPSSCGAKYFLTLVDDHSRAVWVVLLTDKTEVYDVFLKFIPMVKHQFNLDICRVRSDNGTEFLSLKPYFAAHGILFQTSCVATPQQNGRVERKHRHILNVAQALMFQGHLSTDFWGECVLGACYLINRTPSRILQFKSPYEILFGFPPKYDNLRVFGCLCYAFDLKSRMDKFASRSRKCIFVGYPLDKKGWKLFDLETRSYFVSRDVTFYESEFPGVGDQVEIPPVSSNLFEGVFGLDDPADVCMGCDGAATDSEYTAGLGLETTNDPHLEHTSVEGDGTNIIDPGLPSPTVEAAPSIDVPPLAEGDVVSTKAELGRGRRDKALPRHFQNYVLNNVWHSSPPLSSLSPVYSTSSGTSYPLTHFLSYRGFLASITVGVEPRSYRQALRDPGWCDAMRAEIRALENNGTWSMVELPAGKKALGSRWVYKIKYKSDGILERLKARLVVFGNHQTEGVDYSDTFAHVAKMSTVRTFLAVAAVRGWELHQMDVHNTFLHGDLREEVYMKPPPGFERGVEGKVCRLRKSLYGLKQAPRCWFAKLVSSLRAYGFSHSCSDYSLFSYVRGDIRVHVLIYVDDLIISSKCGLLGGRPAGFLMEPNHKLGESTSTMLENGEQYRRLVSRLLYLSYTRPDLAYSVHILSQFLQKPRRDHWDASLRVVRYLKNSPGQGILLRSDSDLNLSSWCDSDWVSCPMTRRSITGWVVFLGGSPISWKTKKQKTVSLSSSEAEYHSLIALTYELKWLKGLLMGLGVSSIDVVPVYCDSQSALHLAHNPVFHERSKHIEVDCHFVRDTIQDGTIVASHVSTTSQLADFFTKPLGKQRFNFLLCKLGICDIHAPTLGGVRRMI